MGGAVQVGALVINMAADVASLKVSLAEANRAAATSAEKMASGFGVIKTSIESAITPLKTLGANVGSLESNMAKAQSSAVSLAKGLILGAAAGMSIDAIKNKIMGVIDTMAHLKTVSEKTGASVENLSKLGFVAKQSGSDIDSIANALGKMSKGMAGADNETKGAGLALKYLGINAKDAAGNLKDPAAMFTEVALKLNDYKDGAGKAAIAQALFGKAGIEMLPTLKLLAEQGDIAVKTTKEQSEAARQYTRDIAKLEGQKGMLFKTIAVALLPTMTDFAGVLLDTSKKTNILNGATKGLAEDNSIESWADAGAMGMARLLDVIVFVSKGVSTLIGSFKSVAADIEFFNAAAGIMNPIGAAKILANGGNPNDELRKALAERNKVADDSNKKLDDLINYNGAAMEQAMAARIAKRVGARTDDTEDAARATPVWTNRKNKKDLNFNTGGEDGDNSSGAKERAAAAAANKASLDADISNIKTSIEIEKSMRAEALAIVAEQHRQGTASDAQYYAAKYAGAIASGDDIARVKMEEIDRLAIYNNKSIAEENATKGKIEKLQTEKNEALRVSLAGAAMLRAQYLYDSGKPARDAQAAADSEVDAVNKSTAALQLQYESYGKLPAQITAMTIAKLQARSASLEVNEGTEAEINNNNRLIASLQGRAAAEAKTDRQAKSTDLTRATELLAVMSELDNAAQRAASSMTSSFGAVGTAIGGMTTALTGFSRTQAAIAAQLASDTKDAHGDPIKVLKAQSDAAKQSAQAQVHSYGDMAGAARGFFKENSAGYKLLEGTEKAFRAYEMAMALESMVKKIFFKEGEVAANLALNGVKLTGEAAATGASVGLAATESSAWGITAVVKAIASLPFPLNLAAGAATLAAVVALGAKVMGGVGGGGSVDVAKDRQAAAGTGSVLGDPMAKSESISKSLEILSKNSGLGLAHSQSMVNSLRAVAASIGNLSSAVARTTGVLGSSTNGINTDPAGFWGSLFGKSSTSITDKGISVSGGALGDIAKTGVTAKSYTDIKESGWWHGDYDSRQSSNLSTEKSAQFSILINSMAASVVAAADSIGVGGASFAARMGAFKVKIDDISSKGLTGTEFEKQVQAVFSNLGDAMATWGISSIGEFAKVGEGAFETLARISNDFTQVGDVLAVLGKGFNVSGMAAVALSENLITAAGGLDKLTSGTHFFVQNFMSEAERNAPILASVKKEMAAIGLAGVTTREQFKAVVQGLDLGSAAGTRQYAAMMNLQESFAQVTPAIDDLSKSLSAIASERKDLQGQYDTLTMTSSQLLNKQRTALDASNRGLFDQIQMAQKARDAQDAAKTSLGTLIAGMKSFADSTKALSSSLLLGSLSTLTPMQQYAEAKRQYSVATVAARGGDIAAQGQYSALATAYLNASQKVNASDAQYSSDLASVLKANDELSILALGKVDIAQASLDALNTQVTGIAGLNAVMLSVAQGIDNLPTAFSGAPAFDSQRYTAGSGAGLDVLVTEVKALRASNESLSDEVKGLRADQKQQAGDGMARNEAVTMAAADAVVSGIKDSAVDSAHASKNGKAILV